MYLIHGNQNYLVFDNEHAQLVTALPYIDEQMEDQGTKDRVTELIKQEMKALQKRDYLEKLPMPKLEHLESEFIQ